MSQTGIGTNSPNASAILDLSSSSKGVLIPRITASQKSAISSPATGLVIFQTYASINTALAGQATASDNVGASSWVWPGIWLSSSSVSITNLSQGGLLYVVPYSSTQFRLIHVGIAGVGAVVPYASSYYTVGANVSWRVTYTFQSM